jgi:predicted unusual protein kinase regulating ubiquinone biosynthesis (AarF/ABC1/UbiB family)
MIQRDYDQVINLLKKIGFLRRGADGELLARAIALFMEEILGKGADLFSGGDMGEIMENMESLLYENPFQIPANFTFLGRALGTLLGLCVGLDPEFDFLDEARPYVAEFTQEDIQTWDIIKKKATAIGNSLIELPSLAERVLSKADRGDLRIKVSWPEMEATFAANTRALNRLTWALTFGFVLIVSAYLLVNHYLIESRYGFVLSALLFLFLLLQNVGGSPGARRVRRIHHPPPGRRGQRG